MIVNSVSPQSKLVLWKLADERNIGKIYANTNIEEKIVIREHFYYVFTTIDVCVLHNFATICIFTYIFIESCKCPGDFAKPS